MEPDESPYEEPAAWKIWTVFGRPWQDLVFAIGEIVFLLTLIPLFVNGTDIPFWTGFGTAIMLYTFVAAQVSYGNWITVCLTFLTATLWLLLGLGV